MPLDLIQTLSELIAIPSVNPMGLPLEGPEYLEGRVTNYLERLFQSYRLPYERQMVEPERENIVARIGGGRSSDPKQLILFEAHQDTVPVTGMTIEPWTPVVSDGRIYGRGACDIKGGLTAMLGAFVRLAEERPEGMPTLVMACTVNEEHGFSGAAALESFWARSSPIIPRRPDAAVIAEPTSLNVVVAHKGVVRWRCHVLGRAAHSSQPHLGENAIFKMARVLVALEQYQRAVVGTLGDHPLCGTPTLSVGTIAGGMSVNIVPDRATIDIDRRLAPSEDPDIAREHVISYIAEHCAGVSVEHDPPFLAAAGLCDSDNGALAASLSEAAHAVVGRCSSVGVPFGTNAAATAAAGIPSVVFGPGSIDQAHTADEWLPIDELVSASEILYRFARHGLNRAR